MTRLSERQYILGENLLVSPVFRESDDVNYYLPNGTWTHLISNEAREGSTITVSLNALPVGAKVLLRNIDSVKSVSGAVASSDELGTLLCLSEKIVVIEL